MTRNEINALRDALKRSRSGNAEPREKEQHAARLAQLCALFPYADPAIAHLSDEALDSLRANYERLGKTDGGIVPLATVLREKISRYPCEGHSPAGIVGRILALCRESDDRRTTYGALWTELTGRPLRQADIGVLGRYLGHVGLYCADNGLPNLSVMVVNRQDRALSENAVANIWIWMRSNGVAVPDTAKDYVQQQAELAAGWIDTTDFEVAKAA